jgi:hypothetical protein
VQTPEQQSVPTRHLTPVSWHNRSQKPPEQYREQHWSSDWQLAPVRAQVRPAGSPHWEPVHANPQHSAPMVQAAPSPRHGIWQTIRPVAFVVHVPLQHCASIVHAAPSPRHIVGSLAQRPPLQPKQHSLGSRSSHSSPAGRHWMSSSTRWHRFEVSQIIEQQSRGVVHGWRLGLHIAPPQVPPVHAREQQSCGFLHG